MPVPGRIVAGVAGVGALAALAFAADRWLLGGPGAPLPGDNVIGDAELAAIAPETTMFAQGPNYTVQAFRTENCTLSVEIADQAVFGITRSKQATLSFFFSSLAQDLSAVRGLDVQFGAAAPDMLLVLRRLTITGTPVLLLEIPPDLDRVWGAAETLAVADGERQIGRYELGEARSEGLARLAGCVDGLQDAAADPAPSP